MGEGSGGEKGGLGRERGGESRKKSEVAEGVEEEGGRRA